MDETENNVTEAENVAETATEAENTDETVTEAEAGMSGKLDRLFDKYYKRFWELKGNASSIPAETYKKMCEILHTQCMRDYEILDGEEGIEIDKQIELLKIKRDEEIECLKLQHDKLLAKLQRKRKALEREEKTEERIADEQNLLKQEEVVPGDLEKKWWQRRARPNRAKVLALREVQIEVADYFAKRESEIAQKEGTAVDIVSLIKEVVPCPRGRKARKRWEQDTISIAMELQQRLQRQEEARERLNQAIEAADNETVAEVFSEPKDSEDEPTEPQEELDDNTAPKLGNEDKPEQ